MSDTLDVRDMQCAQALAQVSRAMRVLTAGATLEVLCNAEDVMHDLLVWAREQGHALVRRERREGEMRLRLTTSQ